MHTARTCTHAHAHMHTHARTYARTHTQTQTHTTQTQYTSVIFTNFFLSAKGTSASQE